MAQFPVGSCSGYSGWKIDDNGHWFPTGQQDISEDGCVVANQFKDQNGTFTVSMTVGLTKAQFQALKLKYPDAVKQHPDDHTTFQLRLVPQSALPIDLGHVNDSSSAVSQVLDIPQSTTTLNSLTEDSQALDIPPSALTVNPVDDRDFLGET